MFTWFHNIGVRLWRFLRREPEEALTTIILIRQSELTSPKWKPNDIHYRFPNPEDFGPKTPKFHISGKPLANRKKK